MDEPTSALDLVGRKDVFLFFGILSPLTAKFINELIAMFGEQQGISVQFAEPTQLRQQLCLFSGNRKYNCFMTYWNLYACERENLDH